jgi:hypothetical protein
MASIVYNQMVVEICKFIHDLMKSWLIVCDLILNLMKSWLIFCDLILKTILDYVLAATILRAIAIIGLLLHLEIMLYWFQSFDIHGLRINFIHCAIFLLFWVLHYNSNSNWTILQEFEGGC